MDYELLATVIETKNVTDSAVQQYIGNNVKSPGLVKGSHYIVKYWSEKSIPDGNNPYWIGQFIGAGVTSDCILNETPRAKELSVEQRYFFKQVNANIIAACGLNGALVIDADSEQRITFYSLLGEPKLDAEVITPKIRPVAQVKPERKATATKVRQTRPDAIPDVMTIPLSELFKKSEPPTYDKYVVAQFRNKDDTAALLKMNTDAVYVLDGVAHTVRILEQDDNKAGFVAKAKELGANSCYSYNKIR